MTMRINNIKSLKKLTRDEIRWNFFTGIGLDDFNLAAIWGINCFLDLDSRTFRSYDKNKRRL